MLLAFPPPETFGNVRWTNADEPRQAESSRTQRPSRGLGGTSRQAAGKPGRYGGLCAPVFDGDGNSALRAAAFEFMMLL